MHHREAFAQAVLEALRGKALVELDDAGQHAGAAGLLDDGGHFAGPARRASCVPQACVTPWPATFQPARGLSFSRPRGVGIERHGVGLREVTFAVVQCGERHVAQRAVERDHQLARADRFEVVSATGAIRWS